MNKAGKHVQAPTSHQKNVMSSIMSFLPDNRPITSLQIVEDYEKCPKNFVHVHRTYDQDSDGDLWRENNILFGRPTSRYLCLSKTEGLPEYVVETLRIISEKDQAPKGFSLLSRTADTEQKAWRKKQIVYKLSKRNLVTHAVSDIILCSKLKTAPEGFKLAGEINGILICYKTGVILMRSPPPVPVIPHQTAIPVNSELEKAFNRLNLSKKTNQPLPPLPMNHDYEEILASYQISPQRRAPKPPTSAVTVNSVGTLGAYSDLDGVPLIINPNLIQNLTVPSIMPTESTTNSDYDFHLERQILCTIKSSASTNPFFN